MYQRAASGPSSSLCVSSSSQPISTQAIIVQAYLGLSPRIQPFLRVYENFHLHPSWQRFAWPSSRNPLVRPEVLSTIYMNGTQNHSRSMTLVQGTQVTLVTRPWDALRSTDCQWDELLEEVLKLQLPFWGEFSEMSQLGIYIHLSWSCLWFFIHISVDKQFQENDFRWQICMTYISSTLQHMLLLNLLINITPMCPPVFLHQTGLSKGDYEFTDLPRHAWLFLSKSHNRDGSSNGVLQNWKAYSTVQYIGPHWGFGS